MPHEDIRPFLLAALGLVGSYLSGSEVELGVEPLGLAEDDEREDETRQFLQELEARHAIACAKRLGELLPAIEAKVSDVPVLVKADSKGAIRGRLDIPRYIQTRFQNLSRPRTYPVIINRASAQTPENALIVHALHGLARRLGRVDYPRSSAEGKMSSALYGWVRGRLRRQPWVEVGRVNSLDRLLQQTRQRIRKRQTGNEQGYGLFLEWLAEWLLDQDNIGSAGQEAVSDGLLAFPIADAFKDRVFEIWCLSEVAAALSHLGMVTLDGPRPLQERQQGPIYLFGGVPGNVKVWFQRQIPLGSPRWTYGHSGNGLAGIPDITLIGEGRSPLIIDAKFRLVTRPTRSEETYKMLGYAENFRATILPGTFNGILLFLSNDPLNTILTDPESGRLSLTGVDMGLSNLADFRSSLQYAIQAWLH